MLCEHQKVAVNAVSRPLPRINRKVNKSKLSCHSHMYLDVENVLDILTFGYFLTSHLKATCMRSKDWMMKEPSVGYSEIDYIMT